MDPVKIEDTGFLKVEIGGATVEVDLFDANNCLVDIEAEAKTKGPRERNRMTVEYLATIGFPKVSHGAAIAFTNAIFAAVEAHSKNAPAASASPPQG